MESTETLLYRNPLSCHDDIRDFVLEGNAKIRFENNAMLLENALQAQEGQKANYVLWCPVEFPSNIKIQWRFKPIREPGLAILFFAAKGKKGEDLFAPKLEKRTGEYPLYHHGDINAYHVSYFRRKEHDERAFHTCNLRKSYGFHLVAQGGDPIPDVDDVIAPYEITVVKKKRSNEMEEISFYVDDLLVFQYFDDGKTYGDFLSGGKIGFRQLAPMIGEYSDLRVFSI